MRQMTKLCPTDPNRDPGTKLRPTSVAVLFWGKAYVDRPFIRVFVLEEPST